MVLGKKHFLISNYFVFKIVNQYTFPNSSDISNVTA